MIDRITVLLIYAIEVVEYV